ncbi:MAG: hypothetical protein PUG54_07175 [Firmicutes bacterium]|nr:hypothetical protein [Bacillota bacterium]
MEKSSESSQENKSKKYLNIVQEALMLFFTILVSVVASYFYQKTVIQIAGIGILAAAGCGSVLFAIEQSREKSTFLFDNADHQGRFTAVYLLFLLGCILFPLLPAGGWPYLVVFIGLMLFSNQNIGLSAGTVLLMITVLIQGSETGTFFVYFVGGLVGITVFSYLDETFKVWMPLIISLLVQMVCLWVQEILSVNEVLSIQLFMIPTVNILVCVILLLILLKFFSFAIIYGSRDIYMDINDPECPLLVELKAFSKEEYYHAIHTAYLCDRIAKRLKLDDAVAKACGYYHRIGVLKGENSWEKVSSIMQEYHFPVEVQTILKEYTDKSEKVISRETVVLLFCDTVISSISYLFSKEPKMEMDYQKIIDAIFKKKMESGIIDNSRLSFGELQEMKQILVEEKLYYDFLR